MGDHDMQMANDTQTVEWLGTTYEIILSKEASGGAMSIVRSEAPPESGPPLHVHQDADETFVMLSGQAEFILNGERSIVGEGETVFVPRGAEHTFRVVGDVPSRHLVILTPGGFEGFFVEMGRDQLAIPSDMEEITKRAALYHLAFTGPPLAAV
ncbi:cupin domain-containing protein [Sulfitobacter delicatus]|nr:cupin domain-containing protein [Sulfitobacter delicatus]